MIYLKLARHLAIASLFLGAGQALATGTAMSGLDARNFRRYWHVESESPDYKISFHGDTAEIVAPKGLTLWRNEKMGGDVTIEYDACVVVENDSDRLSDLNCFWMASDPMYPDNIRKRGEWRNGVFLNCYTLQLYYLGYGGNHNSTTRFRRYDGNPDGVTDASARPAILKEYTDPEHLLQPNKWYHIKLVNKGNHVEYWIDGERLVDFRDPSPLTEGWFGFRTTASRTRIANFSYTSTPAQPSELTLHWIGDTPETTRPVTFGVPFDRGTLTTTTPLILRDAAGERVEADQWTLATWPDGSVKWAAIAAAIPAGNDSLTLAVGPVARKGKAAVHTPMVNITSRQIEINTGTTKTFIPRSGKALIDSIVESGTTIARKGRLVASTQSEPLGANTKSIDFNNYTSVIDTAVVELTGDMRSLVKITGRHMADDGSRSWLPFTVRLYFYRGTPEIKMIHTVTFDGDQNKDFINGLGVRFDIPLRDEIYNRHVAFTAADGGVWSEPVQPLVGRRPVKIVGDTATLGIQQRQMLGVRLPGRDMFDEKSQEHLDNWAAWDGFRLSQLTPDGYTVRKRATGSSPWIGTHSGHRTPGYGWIGDTRGGLGINIKDFWQAAPSGIEVDGARTDEAMLTAWLWSPDAEPMDLRHYDERPHGLQSAYEDVQEGMSTPYGVARTTTLTLLPGSGYKGKEAFAADAGAIAADARLMPTPEYLQRRNAFGIWSLPDTTTEKRAAVEKRLAQYLDFYRNAIEQNRWYGFWNYGDVMHAYDPVRHSWLYDVGGYAWDNTELGSNLWLWYSFLRTADPDVWRMAEAMARHVGEVDVYHIGPNAGLGSRHNVSHWGCGAKEARISQGAFIRFLYYLTGDERSGDLMSDVADNDHKLYTLDPMRLAEPRDLYPCTAPARLRIGPDWLAYAGNWLGEWERTGNTAYRDKIMTGMKSIANLPGKLFTGPMALGYDPATGVISTECDPSLRTTNHLMTIMGGFEVMNEIMPLLPDSAWAEAWLDHAANYKQMAAEIKHSKFRVSRLQAYAAWQRRDAKLAAEAWTDLLTRLEHTVAPPFRITTIKAPEVPAAEYDECTPISTNDAALWSLDAIYMQEVIPQD